MKNEDINKIRSSDKLFVSADKTQNYYEITKENYSKILHTSQKLTKRRSLHYQRRSIWKPKK